MPGHARKDIVRFGEIATYHCWSRCVQKAFLCGYDRETERDFSYRRAWIEDLLAYQAGVFAVDVGNFSMRNGTRFTHGSGASQRLVVEMTPEGPVAFNALPGGQSRDPDSPHFDDEAMLWIRNDQPAMFFHEADIVEHAEGRARVTPR